MLKGIPDFITPPFLYALSAMGHGDSMVIADANFPAYRLSAEHTLIHVPTLSVTQVLNAVLDLIVVDQLKNYPAFVMQVAKEDREKGISTPIWQEFKQILKDKTSRDDLGEYERLEFYAQAQSSQLIVLTGDKTAYANVMLYKGTLN